MADETKELKEAGAAKQETTVERSEQRFQDLAEKLKKSSEDNAALKTQLQELQFGRDWDKVVSKYPNAKEHFEEIKKEFQSGRPVEDATVVILHKNNKLMTAEQINSEEKAAEAVGGSADTKIAPPRDPREVMRDPNASHEERVKILQELERKGELGIKV